MSQLKKSVRARNGAYVERNGMNSKRKSYGWPDSDSSVFACASCYSTPGYRRFCKREAGKAARRQAKNLIFEYLR